MSDAAIHPIRFILSDVDGTLLHPDHSLGQRTADAVRALREAGVLFSLASGRPPRAMRHAMASRRNFCRNARRSSAESAHRSKAGPVCM